MATIVNLHKEIRKVAETVEDFADPEQWLGSGWTVAVGMEEKHQQHETRQLSNHFCEFYHVAFVVFPYLLLFFFKVKSRFCSLEK